MEEQAKHRASFVTALGARWFWESVGCLSCFAAWAIVSRLGGREGIPDRTMYWLFIWGALPVGLVLLGFRGFKLEGSGKGIAAALTFGTLGGLGQWMYLTAYEKGPTETAAIAVVSGLYSMVTVVLAVIFLRERIGFLQVVGIAAALAAVTILSLPRDLKDMRVTTFPPPWFAYAMVVLVAWGVVGVFQKIASSRISPESALVWQSLAFLLYLPLVWPAEPISKYSTNGIVWGLLGGVLTNLGTLFLVAAMKHGGKAAVVAPLTCLFPVVVVFLVPFLFKEPITLIQWGGVGCAVVSILFLAR